MRNQIIFDNGTTFDIPEQAANPILPLVKDRSYRCISVLATADAVKAAFVDNAIYRREWESEYVDDSGETVTQVRTEDLSEYSIAAEIVDKRNGVIVAVMGKPTELEIAQQQLAAAEAAMVEGVNSIVDDE